MNPLVGTNAQDTAGNVANAMNALIVILSEHNNDMAFLLMPMQAALEQASLMN